MPSKPPHFIQTVNVESDFKKIKNSPEAVTCRHLSKKYIFIMKLPTVDRFCFCLSLETGAIVLAGFCTSISIAVVTLASYFLSRYISFYKTLNETDQDFFRIFLIGSIIMHAVYTVYFTIVVIASIMLIVGVRMVNIKTIYSTLLNLSF